MALAFYEDQQQNEEKQNKSDNRSLFSKITDALFGGTKKFAGTVRAGAGGVYGLGKITEASIFGSDKQYQDTVKGVNDTLNKDLESGKTFFKNRKEAQNLDTGGFFKKSIGAGTEVASEILPYVRGAKIAITSSKVIPALLRAGSEGSLYAGAGDAGQQLSDTGEIDPSEVFKSALIGGGTGMVGFGIGKGVAKAANKLEPVYAHEQKVPDLTDTNTEVTTPNDAKATVAQSAKVMDIKPQQSQFKQALTGEAPKTEATTPVGKGAETIAQKLDDQLSTFNQAYKAPDEVLKKLEGSDAVTRKARNNDWLNRYEDTLSVLGRHFGKVGTDLGYKLAEGAKKVSDIQEVVRPSIDKTQKLLSSMAKSKSGRADIQSRIYSALEDRANADQYLHSPKEKELYDEVAKVFDFFKEQRLKTGKSVIAENYSPRAAVSNALDAPERLLNDARSAFSPDVQSRFSKQRVKQIDDAEINRNIIDLLPQYASSQAKEFGYEGAMKFAKENLSNVNPAYLTDAKSRRQGEEYLRELLGQVLDPPTMSKAERFQNKLIGNTYKATLSYNPRYALQNLTQRIATQSQVSKGAIKLARQMDKVDTDQMRKGLIFGDSTVSSEMTADANGLGVSKKGRLAKLEPGAASERVNVHSAFDRGVAQEVVESQVYKDAIKQGMKPRDAAKLALQDPALREAATRRGNMVVNDTQFGANFVTKPEFFRETKTFFGLSDKWFKQYQRFPQGMVQNISTILRANDARALDILKRGNPAESNLVDFKYSAEALHNGVDDLIKGIKNGEVHDVSLEVAEGYKKTLQRAIGELNKGMKANSQVRGGKTAKSVLKMWAAASAIQWLFDGGFAMNGDQQGKEIKHAAAYGAPITIPTRDQNPLAGATIPSSPFKVGQGIQARRLLNFVPGVGVVANRGHDVGKFIQALMGDNNQ